jgi:hypothetical protein
VLDPQETPLPPGVLLIDDFSSKTWSMARGWSFASDSIVAREHTDEGYQYQINDPELIAWGHMSTLYTNFGIEVEGHAIGDVGADYGIIFRFSGQGDTLNTFFFLIHTTGTFSVLKIEGGEWVVPNPVESQAFTHIRKGDEPNTLRVLADEATLSFYINGHHVETLTDQPSTRGRLGVFAGTRGEAPARVVFTRVTVYTVEQARIEWEAD